eukprot:jgi/Chrzof1/1785/Cz10g21020.t1
MSRSSALVVGYLMWKEHLTFAQALHQVKEARPMVDPNWGFCLQLQQFESQGCCLATWQGWDRLEMKRVVRSSSASGRSVVHGLAEMIRHFHVHTLDDDTVYTDDSVLDL